MSPDAKKVLLSAYENYQKTGELYYSCSSRSSDEWFRNLTGVRQLYEDGLIENVPDFIQSGLHGSIPILSPVTFSITAAGINKIRSGGEF